MPLQVRLRQAVVAECVSSHSSFPCLSCQGLAGPWYARRECVAVKVMGSVVRWFEDSDEGASPNWTEDERKQWIAGNRRRQD